MTQHRLECEAFGVTFCLGSAFPELLDLAAQELPYGSRVTRADTQKSEVNSAEFFLQKSEGLYRILLDGEGVTEWQDLARALEQLRSDLMIHVANFAPDLVFLHAGVVAWRGHALVLPGPSFAGKSTLVSELVRAGAIYYSDEYALVDEAGNIHPYARDLQMRQRGGVEQSGVAVGEFGGVSGAEQLRAGSVIFCHYAEDAEWAPEPVSPGMAVLEMLQHTIPVQRTPGRVMSVLTKMMTGASAFRTLRGDAAEAAEKLLSLPSPGRQS